MANDEVAVAGVLGRAFGMDPIKVLAEPNSYRRLIRYAAWMGSERLYAQWRKDQREGVR